ncbi:MAG: hypothetical protein RIQ72_179, partial [Candidatus Parcubacteria bacterium]
WVGKEKVKIAISNVSDIYFMWRYTMNKKTFEDIDRWLCVRLPVSIRVWWHRLWIRRDEFHPSLNMCIEYACTLSPDKRLAYRKDIVKRRDVAHQRT